MQYLTEKFVNFASIIDPATLSQSYETATMPFIHPHLALMPDAHLGLGATVGSVIPTDGAIMPAAVGVDIGCGMRAVLTQFTRTDIEAVGDLRALHASISRAVPLSAGNQNARISATAQTRIEKLEALPGVQQAEAIRTRKGNGWRHQLGSLGSGNHFIECSYDELDRVWLFLHSGSRGVGNRLAQQHIRVAQEYCRAQRISLPNRDLAYLVEGSAEFDAYIEALRWAQEFAALNRDEMMDQVISCLSYHMGTPVQQQESVGCHHNYTTREVHGGREVWLSRKGAIDAHVGVLGLIPGSMGDASYVVRGKGLAESLHSAPHGAGREYSRTKARATFDRADLDERMAGIVWATPTPSLTSTRWRTRTSTW